MLLFSQRDRPIIKDLLVQIDHYCGRNLQKRDEKIEAERRRQHEAQHAQLGGSMDTEQTTLTAGENATQNDQEEEQEVDPLIVGSLDNVYKDEPGADMKEDPFKKVPIMDDHEKPSSMMEMEKSVDAMVALIEHPGSPLPEDATSLDRQLRQAGGVDDSIPPSPGGDMPDLMGEESGSNVPMDLAMSAQQSVDVLEEAGDTTHPSQPVDLTKGVNLPLVSSS